jgi:hypothetical protein
MRARYISGSKDLRLIRKSSRISRASPIPEDEPLESQLMSSF